MFELFLGEMRSTTKNKEKEKILEKYLKEDDIIYEILKYTYDYKYIFYLSDLKLDKEFPIGTNPIDKIWDQAKDILDKLRKREITGNEARNVVSEFLKQLTKFSQDIFIKILNKNLLMGANVKTINKVLKKLNKETIPTFEVQLANKYEPNKSYKTDEWYVSNKLDGVRVFFTKIDGEYVALSRNGKPYTSIRDYQLKEMREILDKFDLDFLDGEFYEHGKKFEEISSIMNSDVNLKEDNNIKFHIFAVWNKDIKNIDDMIQKMEEIDKFLKNPNIKFIKILKNTKIRNDWEEIEKELDKALNDGYEGIMLRNPKSKYEFKRSDDLLKVKKMHDAAMEIIGFDEGKGKYKRKLGKLIVKGKIEDSGINGEIKVKVGSGLTDDLREKIWNNKDEYMGKMVDIQYFEISKNSKTGKYSLRFPVFLRFRD